MFSEDVVGLIEEMRFQQSSELSSTDGCWAEVDREGIPDDWCCNVEAPPTDLSSGPWRNHVSIDRLEMSATGMKMSVKYAGPEPRTQSKAISATLKVKKKRKGRTFA